MKALCDKSAGQILSISDNQYRPGGKHGWMLDEGSAVWVDVPSGESWEDCDYISSPPSLVLNAQKKATRLAAVSDKNGWMTRIKNYNPDTASAQDQKQFQKDIVLAIKYLIGN